MKRSKSPPRPKLPTFDERIAKVGSRYVGAAFTGKLHELPPGIADEWRAAHAARDGGRNKHMGRTKVQHDWRSVYELAVAANPVVFTGQIKAKDVYAVLATVEQTKYVVLAQRPSRDGDSAFIRWVRRGIKHKKLPPKPTRGPHPYDDGDGG